MTSEKSTMTRHAEVFTTAPTVRQKARVQWRLAYARIVFDDGTSGVVALATAPLTVTPERILRDTAQVIVEGMMLTYPGLSEMGIQVRPESYYETGDPEVRRSLVHVSALTDFERRHPVEFSALYFQMPFLEKVEIAYERVASHDANACEVFFETIDRIQRAVLATSRKETTQW
jgi:hypothetical protein